MHLKRSQSAALALFLVALVTGAAWWFYNGLEDSMLLGDASPLHRAVIAGEVDRVRQLISEGADVNARMYASKAPTRWDAAPLHLAASGNEVAIISRLLDAGAERDASDRLGFTPLHRALASEGADAAAQALIQAGASIRSARGRGQAEYAIKNYGQPLQTALQGASIETVEMLLEAGADPAIDLGENAIGCAWPPDLVEKLQLLVELDFPVNVIGPRRRGPLHIAAMNNDIEAINFLLDHGADFESPDMDYGFTPLLSATYAGAHDAIRVLLERGANPKASAEAFGSPIYVAAFAGKTETLKLLLELDLGIDIQAGRDSDGATPLHMAYWNGNAEMIRLLIDAGADTDARTTDGRLPSEFRQ